MVTKNMKKQKLDIAEFRSKEMWSISYVTCIDIMFIMFVKSTSFVKELDKNLSSLEQNKLKEMQDTLF